MSSSVNTAGQPGCNRHWRSSVSLICSAVSPLNKLNNLSRLLGREIYIKRDDLTPLAAGGNKAAQLEFLDGGCPEKAHSLLSLPEPFSPTTSARQRLLRQMYGLKCGAAGKPDRQSGSQFSE